MRCGVLALAVVPYVLQDPVAAGIVTDPARYEWSSAACHLGLVDAWTAFLQNGIDEMEAKRFGRWLTAGKPGWPNERRGRGNYRPMSKECQEYRRRLRSGRKVHIVSTSCHCRNSDRSSVDRLFPMLR